MVFKLIHDTMYKKQALSSDYMSVLVSFLTIVNIKSIANALVSIPTLLPSPGMQVNGVAWEKQHCFSPFLTVWVDVNDQKRYFGNLKTLTQNQLNETYKTLRSQYEAYSKALSQIFSGLLKANKETILQYFALVLSSNNGRNMENPNFKVVSSDVFAINLQYLLFDLALPVVEKPGLLGKVEYNFPLCGSVFPSDLTPILKTPTVPSISR
jgi:ubiquitin conjugation factor E4 B